MQTEFKIDPRGGHNRYNCNFDFFKHWTDEMAYVLGFLYADGDTTDAISSRTQYIEFSSTDKDILKEIKVVMNSGHPLFLRPAHLVKHRNGIYKSNNSFIFRIGSRTMFNDLIELGVTPHKSKTIIFPSSIPEEYLRHFVRGYFDGDGCVYFRQLRSTTKPLMVKGLSIIFTSGSFLFLEKLEEIIRNRLILNHRGVHRNNRAFQLRYYTRDSIKIFKFLYKSCPKHLCLRRKFNIFNNYFNLSKRNIDFDVNRILKNYSESN